jgi:hypothetical protein
MQKPLFRQLQTPYDRGDIYVHHEGDPWAESELLGLPGCPWRHFRRNTIFGVQEPAFLGSELVRALQRMGLVLPMNQNPRRTS